MPWVARHHRKRRPWLVWVLAVVAVIGAAKLALVLSAADQVQDERIADYRNTR